MGAHRHGSGSRTASGRFGVPVALVLGIVKRFKSFKVVTGFLGLWPEMIVVGWICNETVRKCVQQSVFDCRIGPE